MCEELKQAFEKLKSSRLSGEEEKFVYEARVIPLKKHCPYPEYYLMRNDGNIEYYRSYDTIYDTIKNGFRSGPEKVGKRKPEKRLYITDLPDHCYK